MTNKRDKRTVGILGTSANPMHEGHIKIGQEALFRLGLDEVQFMVTPHSPHKDPLLYAPLEHRTHLAHLALMSTGRLGNRFKVSSDFEAALLHLGEENSTANMLAHYVAVYPNLQPVWIMGEDSLGTLHTWGRYDEIMQRYPVVVVSRSGSVESLFETIAGNTFRERFVAEKDFLSLPGTWTFLDGVVSDISSTMIRKQMAQEGHAYGLCSDAEMFIRNQGLYGVQITQ